MKNPVLQKASEHFKNQLSGGMKSIEVPEWETTIYYKPVATFAEQQRVFEYHNKGQLVEALIETLITRAKDEEGKSMFARGEFAFFMREVDPNVLTRIVTEMNATTQESEANLGN